MIRIRAIVRDEMSRRGWTAYELHKRASAVRRSDNKKVARDTVYKFLEGRDITSINLEPLLDVLGLSIQKVNK